MEISNNNIFLAANSAEGFYSCFKESYDPYDGWTAYLIKGGPGTGKSSVMKYMAQQALEHGFTTVLCPCSSDPDSLDGVIIKELKTVFLDATAPHIVEPENPGVCEQIFDAGAFWNQKVLKENGEKIKTLSAKNKFFHKTAARYLSAAGYVIKDNIKLVSGAVNFKKTDRFAQSLIKNYLKAKGKNRCKKEYFLTGITPKGIISFEDTVNENYKTIIAIDDKYGICANAILKQFANAALLKGYGVHIVKSPFVPSEITEHILIPELSLAIVTENDHFTAKEKVRTVHATRFYDKAVLKALRNKVFFNRRLQKSLILSAISALKSAKEVHDELEKYYIKSMNFTALKRYSKKVADKVFWETT